jgi:hypothetical protein
VRTTSGCAFDGTEARSVRHPYGYGFGVLMESGRRRSGGAGLLLQRSGHFGPQVGGAVGVPPLTEREREPA